jgi:carboxymethylenebutenolidase
MPEPTQADIDQRVFELYDEYCHGHIDRREFVERASVPTVGGLSALVMAQALLPRYALAQTISFTDQRIKAKYVTYPSPGGSSGTMRGYLVQPSGQGPSQHIGRWEESHAPPERDPLIKEITFDPSYSQLI